MGTELEWSMGTELEWSMGTELEWNMGIELERTCGNLTEDMRNGNCRVNRKLKNEIELRIEIESEKIIDEI